MSNLVPTLRYVWLTVKHKLFVARAGIRTRTPLLQLIIHDWSKFTTAEAPHYGRQFFGAKDDPLGFAMAWNHHQKTNQHHWEYWIPESGHNRGGWPDHEPLPMPEHYVREMVADWLGASRAYEGKWPETRDGWPWLVANLPKIRLHADSRNLVEKVLDEVLSPTPRGGQ